MESSKLKQLINQAGEVFLDKTHEMKLLLSCLLADGHILIEDVPGTGKTTLAKVIAGLLGLSYNRIQFTNDLLPADILGNSIFDPKTNAFTFHKGPIFTQILLADELNRATPKTQSACLQAMAEAKVSIDGVTHDLSAPFFLIATQNPGENIGTYPLPESQLDRFLMRIKLGFPGKEAEKQLIMGEKRSNLISNLSPLIEREEIIKMKQKVLAQHVAEPLLNYLQDLIAQSRVSFRGLSTRCAIAWLNAAKAWSYIDGRDFVEPEDIQAVAIPVMNHRLQEPNDINADSGVNRSKEILESVSVS